jgi:mannose-6-phosphate isomerase-like protein (cupin superfamily)
MHVARKTDLPEPIENSSGEQIWELIGLRENSGGATTHSVALVTLPHGKSSDNHYHRISDESYYILSGQARMTIDDQEFDLLPGDACFIAHRERHQIWNAGQGDLEFIAVCVPAWEAHDSVFV